MINSRKIIRAIISYIPILKLKLRKEGTGPVDGKYYHNIYTSHIQALKRNGFKPGGVMAEFGPGDTLGVGICAILDNFDFYYAFDRIKHADSDKNMKVLGEIKTLYNKNDYLVKLLEDSLHGGGITVYSALG